MSRMNDVVVRSSLLRWVLLGLLLIQMPATLLHAQTAGTGTLDRVRASGKLTIGYYAEARPYTFQDKSNSVDGYAIAVCRQIVTATQELLHSPNISAEFVAVDAADRFKAVKEGRVDLLCGPSVPSLSSRADVSFSLPILTSGTGVMLRKDAPAALRDLLETGQAGGGPVWRGSPMLAVLQQRNFAVISGSLSEKLLRERRDELKVNSVISSVPDLNTGLKELLDGKVDGFFAERNVLLDLSKNDTSGQTIVLNRTFDNEPLSLALSRGDPDFRLLVDQVLSRLYRSGKIDAIYEQYLGKPDSATQNWFRTTALPE
jgi:polar amino acid transport system substrate-binding protein